MSQLSYHPSSAASYSKFSDSSGSGVLTVDRSLTAQLLEHLSSASKSVTRLADGDVEHELLDAQLAHRVGGLVLGFRLHGDKNVRKKFVYKIFGVSRIGFISMLKSVLAMGNIPWRLLLA